MATEADYASLRKNTGDTITSLDNTAAAALFAQAATIYSAGAVFAGVRVLRILELMGGAYKQTSYTQNQESVDASDIFDHLTDLLKIWQRQVADAQVEDAQGQGIQPPASGSTRLKAVW